MSRKGIFKRNPKKYARVVFNSNGLTAGISIKNVVGAWNDFYENYEGDDG